MKKKLLAIALVLPAIGFAATSDGEYNQESIDLATDNTYRNIRNNLTIDNQVGGNSLQRPTDNNSSYVQKQLSMEENGATGEEFRAIDRLSGSDNETFEDSDMPEEKDNSVADLKYDQTHDAASMKSGSTNKKTIHEPADKADTTKKVSTKDEDHIDKRAVLGENGF